MNIGLTVKPVSAARAGYTRIAVATELAPSQTVTVAAGSAAAAHDSARGDLDWSSLSREVLIDPQTREVIYRALTRRAGQAVEQAPEEATLKLRAYQSAELRSEAEGQTIQRTV